MTQIETKIREILVRFCNDNGGGPCEPILTPGRFGGFNVTLVWDGFQKIGLGSRQDGVIDLLVKGIGADVFQTVRTLHLRTFAEKIEEDALEAAIPQELPWLASRYH